MKKFLIRSQETMQMPQCVHLPLSIRTYQIGSVLLFVATILLLSKITYEDNQENIDMTNTKYHV